MQTNEKNIKKKWIVRIPCTDSVHEEETAIEKTLGVHPVVARLLVGRGCHTPEEARAFVNLEKEMLCDPFLLKDIEPAVERIRTAIDRHEKITVYGDYDVDGVTAVCTLYLWLRDKGADVGYYIPNRSGEGYGVSCSAVDKLADEGTTLIITVDTGITAVEEVLHAKTRGVDFVITDHHECRSNLPEAVATVNPHRPDCAYPFKDLAGVGVVFKLIAALEEKISGDTRLQCIGRLCEEYADLVAIGTIADVMPIVGENKLIVRYGLEMIGKTKRKGLRALMDAAAAPKGDARKAKAAAKITSSYIGYTIAPRINAAGRIRSASRAVELFLAETDADAASIAAELCEANRERQDEENRIMQDAYKKIDEGYDFEKNPVIVLDADDWHHGVIGIVASRITEKYGLPSILISFEGCNPDAHTDSDMGKGSGRSIKGMNLVDALVACSEHLAKFGGHELAAGLSVTRGELPAFREALFAYARGVLTGDALEPTLEADCVLSTADISLDLAEELRILEPYGVANPVPVFILRGVGVLEVTPVSGGKHTRFLLGNDGVQFPAIFFGKSPSDLNIFVGDTADILFNLDINEWNGRRTVQLIARDMYLSDDARTEENAEREIFARIWAGENFEASGNYLPTRDDFAAVYTLVCRSLRNGCDSLSHRAILSRLAAEKNTSIGYVKLKIIIRVLQEMNLLGIEEYSDEHYTFKMRFSPKKVDLEKSNILKKLRSQQKN